MVTSSVELLQQLAHPPHRARESLSRGGTKATDDDCKARFRQGLGKMLENFTWRNIAIFVIALLIVSYLMLLGIIITVDRLNMLPATG
jgi:hypothetical protein